LVTTVFFADSPDTIQDPVLLCISGPAARARMFASHDAGHATPTYRYDIVTRGESETPFFLD